ncbi:hypothetical protein KOR42_39530 [Thalassoglobus neptunius]|uniref:Uncharacterized protein n=1 Tax=Thalassoglobus neptunius TaxID=1938619 RepID=A0A5C5WEU7_9PLAN|nr:hypothetical protein [Thalassoglobus neptunius]TWT49037.1 hypothetical protein KOR42_39530 [Thalassoglobus neptunius]
MNEQPKSVLTSKTLWANLIVFAVFAVGSILESINSGGLPDEFAGYALPIVLVLNVILRLLTSQPLDLSLLNLFKSDR